MEQDKDTLEFILPNSLEEHITLINSSDVLYLSVYQNGSLVGFCTIVADNQGSAELRRIVIASKGNGLGQQVIKEVERYCSQKLQCSKLWLDVFKFNSRGIHIYTKLGFTQFKTGSYQGKELLFMVKELT
ncbi:GNAT family N-acetyltransferase [Photobacterium rosenbergii]|nr:GNAT family N-acetyltransferase [Photobacterium rosenbergii]